MRLSHHIPGCLGLLAALFLCPPASGWTPPPQSGATPAPSPTVNEYWVGRIDLPERTLSEIPLVITLIPPLSPTGTWSVLLDIPPGPALPGASATLMADVRMIDDTIEFVSPDEARNAFRFTRAGSEARGTVTVGGVQQLPLTLRRVPEAEARQSMLDRPQTPRPPFPYTQEPVTVSSGARVAPAEELTPLGATLVLPNPPFTTPYPAVLLIGEDGAERNQSAGFHQPFAVLADALARAGFASLRYDDRGSGLSGGDTAETTIEARTTDAASLLSLLRADPRIDPSRIFILGLGEGAVIAAQLARITTPQLTGLILLSGRATTGATSIIERDRARLNAEGESPAYIQQRLERRTAVLNAANAGDEPALRAAIAEEIRFDTEARRGEGGGLQDWQRDAFINQSVQMYQSPRFRSFLPHDPIPALKSITLPTLALVASRDLTNPPATNLEPLKSALAAGNPAAEVHLLGGLNHRLQPCLTGFDDEVTDLTITIDPRALTHILTFARRHAAHP
ncbi:MAG: alpha/beta hydrolase [Phycisphaerales bacterium]|nr:alpha/beta hydrolase [Phycisphaerales bacterium]